MDDAAPGDSMPAYRRDHAEVLKDLGSDAGSGLAAEEARRRLKRHGPNRLAAAKPVPAWRRFLAQFQDVLVILLLIATAISAGLWLYERSSALPYEAIAILAIVLLNAVIGFVQQSRAEAAVSALRRMTTAQARVVRDGRVRHFPARQLVPGDIVLVEAGDSVPADARLVEATALQAAEAALTGESVPVSKKTDALAEDAAISDRQNMIFSGTHATYGRGRAVVTATGMQTEMGRIASMLDQAPTEKTPLQEELGRVGKLLGVVVVVIALVMIATILLTEDVRGFSALFDVLIFGVALAVAAVPEGLPAIVTGVLALGVQRMAKRNAIVRHLSAVETLGSANVIASDKTGTLTKNEMTVRAVVTASGRVDFGGTGYAPEGDVTRHTEGDLAQRHEDDMEQRHEDAVEQRHEDAVEQRDEGAGERRQEDDVERRHEDGAERCQEDGAERRQQNDVERPHEGDVERRRESNVAQHRKGGVTRQRTGDAAEDAIGDDLRRELEQALTAGERANNAGLEEHDGEWSVEGDPTEAALIVAARKAGLEKEDLDARFERLAEVPFSSERKMMTTVHSDAEHDDRLLAFSKGAPDVLLARCSRELARGEEVPLDDARRREILDGNEALAREALRTLGMAYRSLPRDALDDGDADERLEQELVFAGLVGMLDPPRAEAMEAAGRAREAGIRSLMITGDHPITASVIARELGIADDERVTTGADLGKLADEELAEIVRETRVYARVDPEHKLRIVRALQEQDAIVAVTGDGVNDAPALKSADIGVAMGISGTDVSKQAADIVLADDNFASIVAAVEEGRGIFANIRKFLRYLLSSNIGEVLTMFFGVLLADFIGLTAAGDGLALPLVATQILWINLVTDGAPALALGVNPADPDVMSRPPRPHGEGVITRGMWWGIAYVGVIFAVGTLLVIDASLPGGLIEGEGGIRYAQTMAFTTLVVFQLFEVFNARSETKSAFADLFANRWLWGAVSLAILLQVAVVYLPVLQEAFSTTALSGSDWLLCAAVGSSVLWLRELGKLAVRRLAQ